jgi:hypothetical protein
MRSEPFRAFVFVLGLVACANLCDAENTAFMRLKDETGNYSAILQKAEFWDKGTYPVPISCCCCSMSNGEEFEDEDGNEHSDTGTPSGAGINEQGSVYGEGPFADANANWKMTNAVLPDLIPVDGSTTQAGLNVSCINQAIYNLSVTESMRDAVLNMTAGVASLSTATTQDDADQEHPLQWGMVTTDTSVTPAGTAKACTATFALQAGTNMQGDYGSVGVLLGVSLSAGGATIISVDIQTGWADWSYVDADGNTVFGGGGFDLLTNPSLDLEGYFTGVVGTTSDPGTTVEITFESKYAIADSWDGGDVDGVKDAYQARGEGIGGGGGNICWEVSASIDDP